jgi:sigma-B regulation protein RsbU (phosphoserine phosphatase)
MDAPRVAEQARGWALPATAGRDGSPVCLLVVDDNKLNREMLCARLGGCGYETTAAEDGTHALALLGRQSFDLVLLDVSMPGPSGFEVLEVIRRAHTPIELPVIMATARDDSDDIVRGLELGASDYVVKPFDFPVVLARVQTHLSLKRSMTLVFDLEQRLSRRNEELEAANKRLLLAHEGLRRDLEAAARIQVAFLPHESPNVPGASFAWAFQPCSELAGDSLNVCRLGEEHLGFYVLDVSGHGVAAALLSVTATRVLAPAVDPNSILARGSRSRPVPPAEVAARLNQRFPWDEVTGQFFTLFYATLNVKTHELCYVSAGHPPAIHLRPGETPALLNEAGGRPIGLGDRYQDHTMMLRPGDRLYLYSDGVTEACGSAGEQFGVPRLCTALEESRPRTLQESVSHVLQSVHQWGGDVLRDDLSLLALEVD